MLLAAGTATYEGGFEALEKIPAALRAVVETLQGLGFSTWVSPPGYRVDPEAASLLTAVENAAEACPIVVVYYTGHAVHPERDIYYLVSRQSRPADLRRTGVPARDLLKLLTRVDDQGEVAVDQPTVLVILDCCYSGSQTSGSRGS